MYCPNCGKPAQESQNFCKQCGTNLHLVSQALTGGVPAAAMSAQELKARSELARGIRKVCWGLGLMVFLGVFTESLFFAAIGLLVLLQGAGRVAAALLYPTNQGAVGSVGRRLRRLYQFEPSHPPQQQLPSVVHDRPPSVTEHTTIQLEPPDYVSHKPERERITH